MQPCVATVGPQRSDSQAQRPGRAETGWRAGQLPPCCPPGRSAQPTTLPKLSKLQKAAKPSLPFRIQDRAPAGPPTQPTARAGPAPHPHAVASGARGLQWHPSLPGRLGRRSQRQEEPGAGGRIRAFSGDHGSIAVVCSAGSGRQGKSACPAPAPAACCRGPCLCPPSSQTVIECCFMKCVADHIMDRGGACRGATGKTAREAVSRCMARAKIAWHTRGYTGMYAQAQGRDRPRRIGTGLRRGEQRHNERAASGNGCAHEGRGPCPPTSGARSSLSGCASAPHCRCSPAAAGARPPSASSSCHTEEARCCCSAWPLAASAASPAASPSSSASRCCQRAPAATSNRALSLAFSGGAALLRASKLTMMKLEAHTRAAPSLRCTLQGGDSRPG